MPTQRRKFQRPLGQRRYRKLFVIATEGVKTEPQYFSIFNNHHAIIRLHCLRGSHASAPLHVLKRMQDYLKKYGMSVTDEAWLVIDKDQWTDQQLSQLHAWSESCQQYGLAVSNPKFEYWLLLHFEDGNGIASSSDCTDRLRRHLPYYDKGIEIHQISPARIDEAIERARRRDNPPCTDWPRLPSNTTVYKLIENIRQASALID